MGVREKALPIIISTLIFATLGLSSNAFANTDDLPSQIHAPDRLIVKFSSGVSEQNQNSILSSQSATVLDHLPLMDVKIISVPEESLDAVKNALSKNHSVEYAEYDLGVPPTEIPNDTSYGNQWHLPVINAPGAYDITYGNGFPIVILDSGVDMDHSDLSSKIIHPYNGFTLIEAPVNHVNGCGHGTPVAGAAAAITNNANGVAGVGWDTQIIPVKITDDTAPSGKTQCYGWSNAVLRGVEWAVTNGAKVVNLSYGFDGGSGSIRSAAQLLQDNNGWLVISAGNSGGFSSKTDDSRIIFVASTTSSDVRSSFSSYGDYVDMSGPGSSILTTTDGDKYNYWSGTSFSAPITASVLNLIYSVDPTLISTEAFDILKNSAVDLGDPGWDQLYGYGRVDAYAAVYAASGNSSPITAANDAYSTDEETPLAIAVPGILVNDLDPSGGSLTAELGTSVTNGALIFNSDGSFTYSPSENFDGVDSFTYHATNGTNNSNTATVTISINSINDAPVAQDDSANTFENTAVTIDVLANDSDVEGDALNIQSFSQGVGGTVSDNGDGTLSYTPIVDFTGADSFTYQMNDGSELNDSATVNVTVNPFTDVHVGDLEISKSGKKRWTADVTITVHNGTDYSMPGLTVEGTWSGGSSGTDSCVTNSDGWCQTSMVTRGESLTFTVDNITGVGYEYTEPNHDVNGNSNGTSITINKDGTIPGPNVSPDAVDDSASTTQGQPVDVDVLSNDSDPNGDTLSIESITQGLLGTVSINGGMVRYTPVDGNMGLDSFTYTINDGNGETDTATVNVTINEAPPVTYVHVGALDGVSAPAKGPWSTATVTITVHSDTHALTSGVVVSGTWSGVITGNDSCTTDSSGTCSVTDRTKNGGDAMFTITNLSGNGFEYASGSNEDISITVLVS